jgi:4-hydroxy-2-oxoglutarate aldolase
VGAAWLSGVFPPIPTAFAPDGRLRPSPAGFLPWLRDAGLDGVVVLGSTGEAAQLTEAERLQWIGSVRDALPPPLRLIAGTGADSTAATIERTRAAAAAGAEAALVIAPIYFRRHLTVDALQAHYHAVAEASPIPVLIYNMPAYMGYDLGADWIIRLAAHANIVGMKESSGDTARLPRLRQALGPGFTILAGAGEKMVDALEAGADGAIAALANLAPSSSAGIRRAWFERRPEQARQLQATIVPLGEALARGYGVAGVKAGLRLLGHDHGDPRLPLPPLPAGELAVLQRLLEDAKLLPRAIAS